MEKIVIVSREPANHERLIALVERLFPECPVEIVSETARDFHCTGAAVKKEPGSCGVKLMVLGD
jgi:hypothetical protein